MPRLLFGVVVVALVTSAACSRDPVAKSRRDIASGDAFMRAGKYREASIEYRNAIKATPDSVEAHEKLADAAARAQDPNTAAGAILRVAELKPEDPAAQIRAASLYLLAGRYDAARDHAEAAVESKAGDADAHLVLAQALAGLHDVARSEQELHEAVRLAPNAPAPLVALGSAEWSAGRQPQAEADLRKAVAVAPQDVAANRALAMLLMASGRARDAEPLWRVVAGARNGLPFALVDYLIAMNRLDEADRRLDELLAREDTRDAASVRRAAVQYARKERDAAHETLRALVARNPRSVAGLLLQARFDQAEQHLDAALRAAQSAVAAAPTDAEPLMVEAEIRAALGDEAQAIARFEAASKLAPKSPAPFMAIARVRMRQGQPLDAVTAAERAVAIRDDELAAHSLLIETLANAQQRSRAMDAARTAIARWPNAASLHVQLASIAAADGHPDESRRELAAALRLDPRSVPALAAMADLEVRSGRGAVALATIDRELQRRPDEAALLLLLSRTHAQLGENDKAEAALRRLVERDPSNLDAFAALGRLYLSTGRLDAARQQFERLLPTDTNGAAHTMVGMILEAQQRPDAAQRAYEQALATNARAGVAANNLAWLYQQRGRLDEALRWATVARDELRSVPEAKDTLGWVHARRAEYGDALPLLSSVVEARPDNPVYRYHLGYAYWKTGAAVRAKEQLQHALESQNAFAGRADAEQIVREIDVH